MDSYEGSHREPISLHKYLYGNTDPTNGTDPSGHHTLVDSAAATAISNIIVSAGATAFLYSIVRENVDVTRDAIATRAIEGFVSGHSVFAPTQSEFDELAKGISLTASRRREPQIYLHYGFEEHASSFALNGLLPGGFATKTVYPTGWHAKLSLALPRVEPPDAMYVIWPRIPFVGFGPTTVLPSLDRALRPMPGQGQQWFFIGGSGGLGTAFGPISIASGSSPF